MRTRPTEDRERMELFLDLKKNGATIKTITPLKGFRPKLTSGNGWTHSMFNQLFASTKYDIWYKHFKTSKTEVWILVATGSKRMYRMIKY